MIPLLVLIVTFAVLRLAGALGWEPFDSWHAALRGALAAMFCLTASAHWGKAGPTWSAWCRRGFPIRSCS
jgi:hypothetical protein